MVNCPYCQTEIVGEFNFCSGCERQVKCLKCSKLLEKDKTICLICGELLKEVTASQNTMNTLKLEEKVTQTSSSRLLEIRASDASINSLMGRVPIDIATPLQPLSNARKTSNDKSQQLALASSSEQPMIVEGGNKAGVESLESDLLEINKWFTEHADHGVIPSKTLRDYLQKLPSKKQKQEDFAIIFVHAYKQILGKPVSHENLVAVMKSELLHDANFSMYLPKISSNYFKVVDNSYSVNNYDGIQQLRKIIDKIQNPEQIQPTVEAKKPRKKSRTANQPNKAELEMIKPWLDLPLDLNGFDVRRLSGALRWATFGLYIITKILKTQQTVKPGVVHTFLLKKYPQMPILRRTFMDTMIRDKKKVSAGVDNAYSLTELGEKEIENLIKGVNNS